MLEVVRLVFEALLVAGKVLCCLRVGGVRKVINGLLWLCFRRACDGDRKV